MKRHILLSILLPALLLCSCAERTPRFVIIHFNDTHSHLDPLRSGEYAGGGGVIERAAFVDSVRAAEGENRVLLLHAGDWDQGTTYYSEMGGKLEVALINALRYDCLTLGNHEFDDGIESLTERVRDINAPVVCANLDLSSFELGNYVKPYTVINKGGVKIGIVGLICDLSSVVSKTSSARIPQEDPVPALNRYAKILREQEACTFVIALTHVGYDEDKEYAAQSLGVDLFVGGHSHTFTDGIVYVENPEGKKVGIVTDGCWGLQAGLAKIY